MKADAVKRMRAIEAHSDLGAGFALAMRDPEIRGSGTILGTRQSGYIEEIGFDLYNRMLDEAIHKLQGQTVEKPPETKLEIDIETHLSNEYINIRQQKVDIYRNTIKLITANANKISIVSIITLYNHICLFTKRELFNKKH